MISNDERNALIAMDAATKAGDGRVDIEHGRRRAFSERDDQRGTNQRDLPIEIRPAGFDFERRGRAVAGRAALEHVGDVDVLATPYAERDEHVVEEPPGLADERLAPGVF